MIRTCPKCGAYYADDSLAFCLDDGAPLITVDPKSEKWSDGERFIKQKEFAQRKQQRRLKWRRVLMTSTSMLVVTMVVCVVAINGLFYLKPQPDESVVAKAVIEATDPARFEKPTRQTISEDYPPTPSPTYPPSPTPSPSTSPSIPATPSPSISPSPSPDPVYKISGRVMVASKPLVGVSMVLDGTTTASTVTNANGDYFFSDLRGGGNYTITPAKAKVSFTPGSRRLDRLSKNEYADFSGVVQPDLLRISGRVMDASQPLGGIKIKLEGSKLTSTTTDANGTYAFTDLRAGGSYTITPVGGTIILTPGNRSFTNLTKDSSADFSGLAQKDLKPPEPCTDAERARNEDALINKYGPTWQRSIESEKLRIIAESKAKNLPGVNPETIEGTASLPPVRFRAVFLKGCTPNLVTAKYEWQVRLVFHGTTKVVAVAKQKSCGKVAGFWICH